MLMGGKSLLEEVNERTKGSKMALRKDNRELEAYRNQGLLNVLTTMAVANVAPYLWAARVADIEISAGSSMTTQVRQVNVMPRKEGYTVIRVCTYTDIDGPKSKKSVENVVYTFRSFTSQPFEPFVCISRTGHDQQAVLAYADDNERLFDKMDGDDETVLQEVKKKATQGEMRSLARFVDLMAQAIKDS